HEEILSLVERYRVARSYVQAMKQYVRLQSDLESAQGELDKAKKQAKRVDSRLKQRRNGIVAKIEEMKARHRALASSLRAIHPKGERSRLELWDGIDFDRTIRDRE